MAVELIGKYGVSREVFDSVKWHSAQTGSRKFQPSIEKTAKIPTEAELVQAAYGVEPSDSSELIAQVEDLEALDLQLISLMGRAAIIKCRGWQDGAQNKIRIFSPTDHGVTEPIVAFEVSTRVQTPTGGFAGWESFITISALSDVYDIWYGDTEMTFTTMRLPLYRTYRKLGARTVRTEVVQQPRDIEIVDDPEKIKQIAEEINPGYGEELLHELEAILSRSEALAS